MTTQRPQHHHLQSDVTEDEVKDVILEYQRVRGLYRRMPVTKIRNWDQFIGQGSRIRTSMEKLVCFFKDNPAIDREEYLYSFFSCFAKKGGNYNQVTSQRVIKFYYVNPDRLKNHRSAEKLKNEFSASFVREQMVNSASYLRAFIRDANLESVKDYLELGMHTGIPQVYRDVDSGKISIYLLVCTEFKEIFVKIPVGVTREFGLKIVNEWTYTLSRVMFADLKEFGKRLLSVVDAEAMQRSRQEKTKHTP
jgi:hypothetical protein